LILVLGDIQFLIFKLFGFEFASISHLFLLQLDVHGSGITQLMG